MGIATNETYLCQDEGNGKVNLNLKRVPLKRWNGNQKGF